MSKIAKILYRLGFKPKYSTGICGGITVGYGELDDYGYWQYELHIEYVTGKEKVV